MTARIAVAIPACNEADLIGRCLDALVVQRDAGAFAVLVFANGCTDATAAIADQPRGLDLRVIKDDLPLAQRSAGHARRAVMALGSEQADIVLTTDADSIADPDWIAQHRAAFAAGVDAVAGRVSADWTELQNLPPRSLAIGALEWEYAALTAQAEALFDPVPHDPAPRHAQCCGANLGITTAMLARIGGVPTMATGEDRALIAAVEAAGGRVRHAVGPHVTTSARISGRARGGMADALAARQSADYRCGDEFLPADALLALWQQRREARASGRILPAAPDCPRLTIDQLGREAATLRLAIAGHG